ncbi:MAG: hypothetical protein HC836_47415 [Richelia sp. RM2_1_2]|nr:hypothetical protein [Richelia sp. RM2_1_2]
MSDDIKFLKYLHTVMIEARMVCQNEKYEISAYVDGWVIRDFNGNFMGDYSVDTNPIKLFDQVEAHIFTHLNSNPNTKLTYKDFENSGILLTKSLVDCTIRHLKRKSKYFNEHIKNFNDYGDNEILGYKFNLKEEK